jgi:hypothetical protein
VNIRATTVTMVTIVVNNVTVRTMHTVTIETESVCVDPDMMVTSVKTSARYRNI